MKYIDITRTTHTSLDVLMETHIEDYWNVDGERELSDAWTGFTRFILLTERPPDGYTWSGWRLTRKQSTSRRDNVWPDMWTHMSDAAHKKAKQRWVYRETKTWQCQTIERSILYWTKRWRIQAHNQSRPEKVGSSDASSNALQNTDKEEWRNPPQYWQTQDKICLYCWCWRKHETKAWIEQYTNITKIISQKKGWILQQSCSQIHSDASSHENSRSKGSSGSCYAL